ncbi:hypothetical protein G4B88_020825, partial [Cannabis sativa]
MRLPEWLPKLMSLEKLVIKDCPKLLSLPDGMEGLTSLTHLKIEDCDALEERCKREVGPDWHKLDSGMFNSSALSLSLPR